MKFNYFISIILFLAIAGCQKEDVVAPSAEYDIQMLDKVKNEYVNLSTPYELKVNQDYRVLSGNSSEYNSFYMGDTVMIGKRRVIHIFSENANSEYQGAAMPFNQSLKKSTLIIKYTKPGVYNATFVASDVFNNGNDVAYSANSKHQITVVP